MDQSFLWHYLIAIAGGLASFLSPCVLPLVPSYLCFLTGMSADQTLAEDRDALVRRKVMIATVFFVLGFGLVFVILGAGASQIGSMVRSWQQELTYAAGGVLIVFGLHMMGLFRLGFLDREARFDLQNFRVGPGSAFLVGLAFGFGWSPCVGFILGPILGMASTREQVGEGALLLTGYALGLGIPFLLAGVFSAAFIRWMKKIRPFLPWVMRVAGAMMVVTGIAIIFGWFVLLNNWILTLFPALGELG